VIKAFNNPYVKSLFEKSTTGRVDRLALSGCR
jgi:hypothetical protein